ncbi:1,3-beta-glucanosyltransferase [Lachnellula willkommii]|uniref:1,3-beta-glucanosyltransferase n=1 Tax=Lachnellula willkommii TaxID=215461 RepID=A0A559M5G0_9HELO|nr:1,3-beta-glucanosyltransferase [Lachnellula willkommii]
MGKSTLLLTAVASLLFSGASATLDPIVIKGAKFFFNSNDTQFFIKGVAYQAGFNPSTSGSSSSNSTTKYTDPLADVDSCTRDVPELQKLGANTIRTYAIDPTADHSKCMALLDAAGIYVISDLGEPSNSIDRSDPQWTTTLFDRYTSVVDAMATYSNVIGFFAGNEVPNNLTYTGSAAIVKAAVRDTKAYIKQKNYRSMGVGYAADDDQTVRAQVASYLNCGDTDSSIDFWGYNIYEWCGNATFESSGYSTRVTEFSSYSVPSFFAEYGCNQDAGGAADRKFTEVAALYGDQMTPVFSGGIVYEYFEETNDFGLVKVSDDASSVSELADFGAFQTEMAAATPSGVSKGSYNPTNTQAACPSVGTNWNAATPLPPTPDQSVCDCMIQSLQCVAKSSVTVEDVGPLFNNAIYNGKGFTNNTGIVVNTTAGIYGPYSGCNATEKLSWAMNAYYLAQESADTACDFAGNATVVSNPSPASTCSSVLAAATSANSGTSVGTNSGSSSKSGAASSTSKKSEGGMTVGASLGISTAFMTGFTLLAAFSGAGMILL